MAPRKRPRKRDTRMDAAIEHMNTLGFHKDLVRRKMKNLLDVYGGEWVFIESDNYAVLLEAILEEVEKPEKEDNVEENSKQGDNLVVGNPAPEDERGENTDILPSAGSSSAAVEEPTCHPDFINTSTQPVSDTGGLDNPTNMSMNMSIEEDGKGSEHIEVTGNWSNMEKLNGATANITRGFFKNTTAAYSPPPVISPAPLEANPPRGRRKPCYGWISDEEEDDDFKYLRPAPRFTTTTTTTHPSVARDVKKRKTRWDVKPEDYI